MAELSIIVPIYNVEEYLPRCIDSILAQTYTDFELILVNDGSPDNCAEIMEQYAKLDKRIITIHQHNKGVSAARNAGLRIAKGKFIGFVDPDDWIDEHMYQKMIFLLEKERADLACCNWDIFNNEMIYQEHPVNLRSGLMDKKNFLTHYFDLPRTVGGTVWNKVFKAAFIKDSFDEIITIGEDAVFSSKYCLHISKAIYLNDNLYHYFERDNSATRHKDYKLVLILDAKKQLIDIVEKVGKSVKKHAERDYLDSCFLYYNQYLQNGCSQYWKMGKLHFETYMSENWFRVIFNDEIFWKTRIVYLIRTVKDFFESY